MYEVAEDAYRDGVKYLEVRFSPVLHTKEGLSLSQVMEGKHIIMEISWKFPNSIKKLIINFLI